MSGPDPRGPALVRDVTLPGRPTLRVRERPGAGPPVLLVHGLASNARMWDGVADHLAPLATYAVDLRGHGLSGKPDTGYGVAEVAADLIALRQALRLDRVVLAGQSWGAAVVLQAAADDPDGVHAVACVDGALGGLRSRWPDFEDCWTHLAPPVTEGLDFDDLERGIRRSHPDWPESGIQGVLACFERRPDGTAAPWLTRARHREVLHGLWAWEPAEVLPRVRQPVLLIPASHGIGAEPDAATTALLPQSTRAPLEGDHDLHAQHPSAVARLLRGLTT